MVEARVHLYVKGRVQGVFFRYETWARALKFGVTGWVRNLPDGRVEVVAEGERKGVEALVEFCRRGPPGALVTGLEERWGNPSKKYSSFTIRY